MNSSINQSTTKTESIITDKAISSLQHEAAGLKRLFEADANRYGIPYAKTLLFLIIELNRLFTRLNRLIYAREKAPQSSSHLIPLRDQLQNQIRDALVELNCIPLPRAEDKLRRKRAGFVLKYLNVDTHMLEILQADRTAQRGDPGNPRASCALGWSLYNLARHMMRMNRLLEADKLLREFDECLSPEVLTDDLITGRGRLQERIEEMINKQKLQQKMQQKMLRDHPQYIDLLSAENIAKKGNYRRAFREYLNILKADPDWKEAQIGLAWTIEKQLKQLGIKFKKVASKDTQPSKNTAAAEKQIRELLSHYLRLNKVEKPSLLHSLVVARVTQLADLVPDYFEFVMQQGIDAFRPEDFQPASRGDKSYESLVRKIIRRLYKELTPRKKYQSGQKDMARIAPS